MTRLVKITLSSICLIGVLSSTTAFAVDQAAAAGDLASISAISVQAKAALTEAALSGDVDAIAEAQTRSDAIDGVVAQAVQAYAALEAAVTNGNEDAAQSAADDLKSALENATNAFNGDISKEVMDAANKLKSSEKNFGRTTSRPYDPPNIYNTLWDSEGMSAFYQSQFGNFYQSGVTSPTESEATPE